MTGPGGAQRFRQYRWWLVAMVLLLLPLGAAGAWQLGPTSGSPATGSAQVVTQGIARLPGEQVVWRLVERQAPPRGVAKPVRRNLGFVLASDEPILLTNQTSSGAEDVARLAPGEALLVKDGTRQARASLTDRPVSYFALELVAADQATNVGAGTLLFVTAPFAAPPGERDLDLVRNVLQLGDEATLPDTGAPVVVLATDGAIEIVPGGGRARTLQAGEGARFDPGELTLKAVEPGAGAERSAKRLPLAQGVSGASYVVTVIGPEIPPPPTPTPAPTSTPAPTETPQPSPTAGGQLAITVWNCPEGMTVATLVGDFCDLAQGGFDVVVTAPDGSLRTLADATTDGLRFIWTDLPLGAYHLVEDPLPPGYETYFIPGSAAVGGDPDTGYTVTLDPSAPALELSLFNFLPARTGSVTVLVYACPPSVTQGQESPSVCPPLQTGGYDFRLSGPGLPAPLTAADAALVPGGLAWSEVPFGSYSLQQTVLPPGFGAYSIPGLPYDQSSGTYQLQVGPSQRDVTVAVYDYETIM